MRKSKNQVIFVTCNEKYYVAMTIQDRGSKFMIEDRVWNEKSFVWQNLARTKSASFCFEELISLKSRLEDLGFTVLGHIDASYKKVGLVFFKEVWDPRPGTLLEKNLLIPI